MAKQEFYQGDFLVVPSDAFGYDGAGIWNAGASPYNRSSSLSILLSTDGSSTLYSSSVCSSSVLSSNCVVKIPLTSL